MFECKNVAGRVIRWLHLYGGGSDGPEVSIDFEDGENLTISLIAKHVLECKLTRDEGGEPAVLDQYEISALVRNRPACAPSRIKLIPSPGNAHPQ